MSDTERLSNCCHQPLDVSTAEEGTSCYICSGCGKPADPVSDKQNFLDLPEDEHRQILERAAREANEEQRTLMNDKPKTIDIRMRSFNEAVRYVLEHTTDTEDAMFQIEGLLRGAVERAYIRAEELSLESDEPEAIVDLTCFMVKDELGLTEDKEANGKAHEE